MCTLLGIWEQEGFLAHFALFLQALEACPENPARVQAVGA